MIQAENGTPASLFLLANFLFALQFFYIVSVGIELKYQQNAKLIIFSLVGIIALLCNVSNALQRSYAWWLGLIKAELLFKWDLNLPQYRQPQRKEKINYRAVYFGNPAFGGRGPAYIARQQRKRNGNDNHSTMAFDATKGFPGEGWEKLKIATWNCRSLTFERFNFCKSLEYDTHTHTMYFIHIHTYIHTYARTYGTCIYK